MIKTVKVKKQLRLDELLKYVWDNAIYPSHFECHAGFKIHFDSRAGIKVDNDYVHSDISTFTIEVEEEITEDTVFDRLIEIDIDGGYWDHGHNISIDDVKDEDSLRFYALIDNYFKLIWEAE